MRRRLSLLLSGLGLIWSPAMGADVPRRSPEFAFQLPNGKQVLLSQFRGKVVALEFLLTTCPHCQTCSKLLDQMYKEYGPRGFQPLAVAFNEMAMMLVPDYIKDLQLNFPVGVGTRESVLEYLQHPAIMRMLVPQLVFIDRKGVIRAQYSGDDPFFQKEQENMRAQIEALLKEPGAAPASKRGKAPAPSKRSGRASAASSQGLQ